MSWAWTTSSRICSTSASGPRYATIPRRPGDKLDHNCLAVEIEVLDSLFRAVDHVRLDLPADAVEGRVGADRNGGRPACAGLVDEPARVDAVRGCSRWPRRKGWRWEPEVAAAGCAVDHFAAHPVRPAEDGGGGGDVALPQGLPDPGRGAAAVPAPPSWSAVVVAVERVALGTELADDLDVEAELLTSAFMVSRSPELPRPKRASWRSPAAGLERIDEHEETNSSGVSWPVPANTSSPGRHPGPPRRGQQACPPGP